jgi:hypothetical protein
MIKRLVLVSWFCSAIVFSSCAQINMKELRKASEKSSAVLRGTPYTESEAGSAIKQALEKGAEFAVERGSTENGFLNNPLIKIPFPEEATKVKEFALNLGLSKQVSDFETSLNRAAELASKEALSILKTAVTGLTFADAVALVRGGENAATNFLEDKTRAEIKTKFLPVIDNSLSSVGVANFWSPLASAYNSGGAFLNREPINPDLRDYVSEKALDGLFVLLAQEENNIRQNPVARTTELLKKVFGSN